MNAGERNHHQSNEERRVSEELQRPHILMRLAENSLTVSESLRDNYFKNTARFVGALRTAVVNAQEGKRDDTPLYSYPADDVKWNDVQDEVVTFIDGGVGQVQLASQVPILLRVGSYAVRTGERHLAEREQFGYYPIILGDLEGGSKERRDFIDIVRITAELLAGLSALERMPDLQVLMFHGPLVYLVGNYAGHAPFTEGDIDLFLDQYAADRELARDLKEEFLQAARVDIYPAIASQPDELSERRLFEPLSWMAFLYRRLIREASAREPRPIITGVVERGQMREFVEQVLLERVFRGLREKGNVNYFNEMYGRRDLTSPKALLDRLGYNDALLLSMLLECGQRSEAWEIDKYHGLRGGSVSLPGETRTEEINWRNLRPPSPVGFPTVQGSYVRVSETTEPIRIEVFPELGEDQLDRSAHRAYLYARLLPGYGFPVGLDVADKYAHVPAWLTEAYGKLIRHHLSVGLQQGEVSDSDMRRILIQAIYMTNRDWLFRPEI